MHTSGRTLLGALFRSLLLARSPGCTVVERRDLTPLSVNEVVIESTGSGRLLRVWTELPDGRQVADSLSKGQALITTDARDSEVSAALDFLLGGRPFISSSVVRQLAAQTQAAEPKWRPTPRQREVLKLVMLGHSNREIAEALVISPHTVRSHLQAICAELQVKSRGRLVAAALRLKLD